MEELDNSEADHDGKKVRVVMFDSARRNFEERNILLKGNGSNDPSKFKIDNVASQYLKLQMAKNSGKLVKIENIFIEFEPMNNK